MNMMKRFAAATLSLALVAGAPGFSSYAAAGQILAGAASEARADVSNFGAGAEVRVSLPLAPIDAAPSGAEAVLNAPAAAAPAAPAVEALPLYSEDQTLAPIAAEALSGPVSVRSLMQDPRSVAPRAQDLARMGEDGARAAGDAAMDLVLGQKTAVAASEAAAVPASLSMRASSVLSHGMSRLVRSAPGLLAGGLVGMPFLHAINSLSAGQKIAAYLFIVLPSLVLHEIGHAVTGTVLGDSTAKDEGRLAFWPRGLHIKERSWVPSFRTLGFLSHIHPIKTIALPVAMLALHSPLFFAMANPVPYDQKKLKNLNLAMTAFAGPAVNFGLALAGAAAFAALGGVGVPATIAAIVVYANTLIGLFNLIPLPLLDGDHVLGGIFGALHPALAEAYSSPATVFTLIFGVAATLPLIAPAFFHFALASAAALLKGASAAAGVRLASAAWPALAALGVMLSPLSPVSLSFQNPPAASAVPDPADPVDLILVFPEAEGSARLARDAHVSWIDVSKRGAVDKIYQLKESMKADLQGAGLDAGAIQAFSVTPRALYRRINAATIRLPAEKLAEFQKYLDAKKIRSFANVKRRIIKPLPASPDAAGPERWGAVSMDEVLKILNAEGVIAEAQKRWGPPEMGVVARLALKLAQHSIPQPKVAVVDSGIDKSHRLLKRVLKEINVTTAPAGDDIGHGSWVTSMVLNFARWLRSVTHYKTFVDGGATIDDILKALTMAGNDGNLVMSNSWGSDDGDPEGPDSLLVKKLAEEGHIMVFAAGNAGPDANTVGSPAIVRYKDRVMAVAAADRSGKIASFSSRGPGSPKTGPGYPHVPDVTAIGYNVEGAWPAALGDADRVDPKLGSVKAISGTSMSTPDVAGAIAILCMLFGVTVKGEKLDQIVHALLSTARKTGQSPDAEGRGLLDLGAAYALLSKTMAPIEPNAASRIVLRLMSGSKK